MWDRLKAQYDAEIAAKVPESITVTLPDGKEIPAQSWRSTPYEVAKGIRWQFFYQKVVKWSR